MGKTRNSVISKHFYGHLESIFGTTFSKILYTKGVLHKCRQTILTLYPHRHIFKAFVISLQNPRPPPPDDLKGVKF
jgi:hypothetical protein